MCRIWALLNIIKVPYSLSLLSRGERFLFALLVCCAVAGNGWFLAHNVARFQHAQLNPVSQVSQQPLQQFPSFALVYIQQAREPLHFVSCYEGRLAAVVDRWITRRRCNVQISSGVNKQTYVIIWPTVQFLPPSPDKDFSKNQSVISINYNLPANTGSRGFGVVALDPAVVSRYVNSSATIIAPEDGFSIVPDDTKGRYVGMRVAVTELLNKTQLLEFHTFLRLSGTRNQSTLWFYESTAFMTASWNTLTPPFTLADLATSAFSAFSATVAVFSLLFPFRAQSKHAFRCFYAESASRSKFEREASLLENMSVNDDHDHEIGTV